MAVKTAEQPVDLSALNFRPSMGEQRLNELADMVAPQSDAVQARQDAANAALPLLQDKRAALLWQIYAAYGSDNGKLISALQVVNIELEALTAGVQADEQRLYELNSAGIQIRSAISQIHAAQWNKERADAAQAERDKLAADKAAKAVQFQADKLAAEKQQRRTARADADAAYNRPLR